LQKILSYADPHGYGLHVWDKSVIVLFLVLPFLLTNSLGIDFAQAPGSPSSHPESVEDLISHLTPEQKQLFDQATNAFNARHYSDAFAIYKQMLTQLQGDPIISKFASEAAINTGNAMFATTVLKPLAQADSDDWQAVALLTRACAESLDMNCRDSGMAHMIDLHRRGITPPQIQQYILEQVKAGENTLLIRTSLEPWGYYKVYELGQVLDKDGKIFLRITLESSDPDQINFAKEHPKEASKGLRSFSLDAYRETGINRNGQRTQTHYTYKFFVGQPPYETVREEFVKIANGKGRPISTREVLVP
jgi:hypothetical protein